jgi:hypothetical protein
MTLLKNSVVLIKIIKLIQLQGEEIWLLKIFGHCPNK